MYFSDWDDFKYTAFDVVMHSLVDEESWDLVGSDYFGKFKMEDTTATYNKIVDHRYLGHRFYATCVELVEGLGVSAFRIRQLR